MAEIKFTGVVNEWKRPNDFNGTPAQSHPAWVMRVSERHSKKNPQGDWITAGVTRRLVKAGWDKQANTPVSIDFTQFVAGDLVEVIGVESSETYETNGKQGSSLVVKATSVRKLPPRNATPRSPITERTERSVDEIVETVFPLDDVDAPF